MSQVLNKPLSCNEQTMQLRAMSRDYFLKALRGLSRKERNTVERDLIQLRINMAKLAAARQTAHE